MIDKVFTFWPKEKAIPAAYADCILHNRIFLDAIGIDFEVFRECPYGFDGARLNATSANAME